MKPKQSKISKTKDQVGLTKLALKALTKTSSIHAIFLVRQGLTRRTEQFITLAKTQEDGLNFCRNFITPKFCAENSRESLRYDLGDGTPKVNYSGNHLLVKGIDFNRTEMGRTNQNPLWYLVIAQVSIVHKSKKGAKSVKKRKHR